MVYAAWETRPRDLAAYAQRPASSGCICMRCRAPLLRWPQGRSTLGVSAVRDLSQRVQLLRQDLSRYIDEAE